MFIDGSSNQHGCGAGLVIQTPSGEQMEYAIHIRFKATNNKAKYEALLVESLDAFSDSQLVINQVQGEAASHYEWVYFRPYPRQEFISKEVS